MLRTKFTSVISNSSKYIRVLSNSLKTRSIIITPSYKSQYVSSITTPFTSKSIIRHFSTQGVSFESLSKVRNIGISAHIDSGKTTLTERILFYAGRIDTMHEVRGNDGVGAVMDSMELEREKGITIQSAATYVTWNKHHVNIIDTPGHVDFTIEVERALRVLDGAIMVLCGVGGVQSQTITVDRQMRRYNVPRICFINKLDRMGANPFKVIDSIKKKLRLHCAAVQIPIGAESGFSGVVDLITKEAFYFEGEQGTEHVSRPCPEELLSKVEEKYHELLEAVSNVDDEIAEIFLSDGKPTAEQLKAAIRRATIANKFIPVFMGSAYKNKGIQNLLDGVTGYLPNPTEVDNIALDLKEKEARVKLDPSDPAAPFVGLAFKLDQSKFGQLTYMRIYQGQFSKGNYIFDQKTGKKVKVPRLVRMHSNAMEDVTQATSGDIVAMFGIDCVSGTTFTDGNVSYSMTSMFVPEPVLSLSIKPKNRADDNNFSKAMQRFQKEDPTFKIHYDHESKETIMSGMGELHLEVYVERMKREYKVETITGPPRVNFRESITQKAEFDYLHKKQSGGSGQYGGVKGYIEPIPFDEEPRHQFQNNIIGTIIPNEFIPAINKGFIEACEKSHMTGHQVDHVRFVLEDGKTHLVDSNEIAFKLAAMGAFRQAFEKAGPIVLEPVMAVEVEITSEYQSVVIGILSKRKGAIREALLKDGDAMTVFADVPLANMFGFSTELRSCTTGKGEFTMEFSRMEQVDRMKVKELSEAYQKNRLDELKKK